MNIFKRLLIPVLRRTAQGHLLYGRRHRALVIFEKLYKWSPTPDNQFSLALCHMNLCEYDQAIELLEPIHKMIPDQLFAGITYAQSLLLAKRFEDAKEVYYNLLQSNPDNNLLKKLYDLAQDPVGRDKFAISLDLQFQASLLEEENSPAEALDLLNTAVGLTPDDAALHNNIGALKLKMKFPPREVMQDFARAMQINPDNDRYKRNYRKVWQRIKK